MLVKVI